MKKFLLIDANNILYRSFFGNMKEVDEINIALCNHNALNTINKYANKFKVDEIVLVFDSKKSWRKIYTKDQEHCITRKIYKGHRLEGKSTSDLERLEKFNQHIEEFCSLMQNNTGLIILKNDYLEGDDLIAGMINFFPSDQHIILSADKDFLQLLNNINVTLIDPATDKPRDLAEYDYDPDYFLFEKCFRGDIGDNVQSSYPRVRATKIKEAYTDVAKRTNLFENKFIVEYLDKQKNVVQHEYKTKELFDENKLLMGLNHQPEYIKELIQIAIVEGINNRKKFSLFDFLKYCNKYNLQDIIVHVDRYTKLLAGSRNKLIYETDSVKSS